MQPPTVVAIFLLVLFAIYDTTSYDFAHVGLEQNQYFKNLENRITKNEKEIVSLKERIQKSESGYRGARAFVQVNLSSAISARLDTIVETNTFRRNLFELISNLTGAVNRIENRITSIIPKTPPVVACKSDISTNLSYPSSGIWLLEDKSNDWKRISGSPCTHGALNIANATTAVIRWISSVPETCHLLLSFKRSKPSYYTILDSDANCVDSHVTILSLCYQKAYSSGKLCSCGPTVQQSGDSTLFVFHSNSTNATVNIKLSIQAVGSIEYTEIKSFAHILPADKWELTMEHTEVISSVRSSELHLVTALITQSDIWTLDGGTELIWEITKLNLDCRNEFLSCYDIGRMENVGLVPNIWGKTIRGNSGSIPADYRTQVGLVCVAHFHKQRNTIGWISRFRHTGNSSMSKNSSDITKGYAGRITRVPRLTPNI